MATNRFVDFIHEKIMVNNISTNITHDKGMWLLDINYYKTFENQITIDIYKPIGQGSHKWIDYHLHDRF